MEAIKSQIQFHRKNSRQSQLNTKVRQGQGEGGQSRSDKITGSVAHRRNSQRSQPNAKVRQGQGQGEGEGQSRNIITDSVAHRKNSQ